MGAKIVKEKKQGIAAARNAGIAACRTEWIAMLDHDDLWETDKIKYQWDAIEKCPDARVIASEVAVVENGEKKFFPVSIPPSIQIQYRQTFNRDDSYFSQIEAEALNFFYIHTSSLILHREVFETVGMYNEEFCPCDDTEFQLRALARCPLAFVNKPLHAHLRHDKNTSSDMDAVFKGFSRIASHIVNYPEIYPQGAAQFVKNIVKNLFISNARKMSNLRNQSPTD